MDLDVVLKKMRRYCAYRERSHKEVRSKLIDLKVYGINLERVMAQLIEEDFLNELRYAQSYVSGKFRINKWGKRKILNGLKSQFISPYCIRKAMLEIDDSEYIDTLYQLLCKKMRQYDKEDQFVAKNKLIKYATGRGYSYEVIKEQLDRLMKNLGNE